MMSEPLSRKGQERREQILKAAFEEFSRQGFQNATLHSIAKRAKLQPSLVLYHFKDLEEIFVQIVLRTVGEGQKRAADYSSRAVVGLDALRAVIDAMFDWLAADRARQTLMSQFYAQTFYNESLQKLNSEIIRGGWMRIQGVIENGVKSGHFAECDTQIMAETIQFLITGAIVRLGTDPERMDISGARKRVFDAAEALLVKPRAN